ncbi:MAG: disulfide bond formation protein B [Cereibacter changlensis]|uniref:disulfide bond formation protein B n=1 Tax=Cereibacter changlensis TaxID=402884 RepID=UPI00305CFE4E
MSRQVLMVLAGAGSAALLLGAFAFQYLGGMPPCQLCIWQRWPHAVALAAGLIALEAPSRLLAWLGAAGALVSAGIGAFHVGVEQGWWAGLASCSGGSLAGVSVEDLLNPAVDVAQVVRCDAIAWQMLGVSMAGWNVIASVLLAGIWVAAALRKA